MSRYVQQTRRGLQGHSSLWLKGACASLALVAAAGAGAWVQGVRQPAQQAIPPAVQGAMLADAALLQDRITDLAGRVGELQGRVLALEALGAQVVEAAGLHYTAPELVAGPDSPPPGGVGTLPAGSDSTQVAEPSLRMQPPPAGPDGVSRRAGAAEQLGRRIDRLAGRLARQQDHYTLVAAAQSRQAGQQAVLPTLSPVDYPFQSSSFGWRRHPVSGRSAMHEGLDFAAPQGAAIRAASGGVVVRAGRVPGYGRMVEIDHGNGLRTRYAHASSVLVRAGDIVRQGDLIGRVGSTGRSTGAHLHFEIRAADYPLDPVLFVRPADDVSPLQDATHLTEAG